MHKPKLLFVGLIASVVTWTAIASGVFVNGKPLLVNGVTTLAAPVGGGGATIPFPLAAGHSYTQRMSMQAIFPRPDSDGSINSWERQKLQPSGVPLRFPIIVQGGVRPFHFDVLSGAPSGMTIGADLYTNWLTNGFQDYGVLQWAVPTIGSYSVTVRVTDQTGSTLDIAWGFSVVDRDDTNSFRWYDKTNGSNGNSGSYSSPYKDDLSLVFGSSSSSTTLQGQVIFKAGSYDLPTHSGTIMYLDNSKRPVVAYAQPLTTKTVAAVTINGTARMQSFSSSVYSGLFFGDMEMAGGLASVGNWRFFDLGAGGQKRITFWRLAFTNPPLGTDGGDNATSIFFNTGASSDPATYDQYVAVVSSSETNRIWSSNSYGLLDWYGVNNAVIEDNSYTTNGGADLVMYLKDSDQNVTVSMNYVDNSGGGVGSGGDTLGSGAQNQNGGTTGNLEFVYNRERRIVNNNTRVWGHEIIASNFGAHWSARNTIQGYFEIRNESTSGLGPFLSENDIVQTSVSPPIATGTRVTITGADLQGNGSYTDSSFNILSPYLSFVGTRGVQIQ